MDKFIFHFKNSINIYMGLIIVSYFMTSYGGLNIYSLEAFIVNVLSSMLIYVPIVLWKMFRASKEETKS